MDIEEIFSECTSTYPEPASARPGKFSVRLYLQIGHHQRYQTEQHGQGHDAHEVVEGELVGIHFHRKLIVCVKKSPTIRHSAK